MNSDLRRTVTVGLAIVTLSLVRVVSSQPSDAVAPSIPVTAAQLEADWLLQESVNLIERCRKPVIAAVHGYCIGGGIDMTSACDIRMASKDAMFAIAETKVAITADMGTLQRLPSIIGQGWTRELALSGRFFTAAEALQMGYVTRVCEDRESLYEEARKLALEIAANSPLAVEGTKDVLNYSRDNGIYPGLDYVAQKNAVLLPSEDLGEALKAFQEKRAPEFKGK